MANKKPKTAIEKIEWLEERRNIGRFHCIEEWENDDLSTLLGQIKNGILAKENLIAHYEKVAQELKGEGEWISVKDRLPEKDDNYTVGNPEYESGECFFEEGKWTPHNLNSYNKSNITHWKPLSAPPNE